MSDPEFLPSRPAFPPRAATDLDPEAQRMRAALDEPIYVGRIAAALERIAELIADAMREPEPDPEERTGEPEPEPPIDAAPEWQPVKGGRAWLPFGSVDAVLAGTAGELVTVDRLYESEGVLVAYVVTEDGDAWTLPASSLEPPR